MAEQNISYEEKFNDGANIVCERNTSIVHLAYGHRS